MTAEFFATAGQPLRQRHRQRYRHGVHRSVEIPVLTDMLRSLLIVLMAGICSVSAQQVRTPAPALQTAAVVTPATPAVQPDGTAIFRVTATRASRVAVFLDTMTPAGAVPLVKDDRGAWTVTLGPLEPDIYGIGYVVDGVLTNGGFISVPGSTPQVWEPRKVPHGAVHVLWYDSKSLGMLRSVYVYTPPGYERSTARYPTMYLLHGSGGSEASWITEGPANVILDNMIADRQAKPMVLVMPFCHAEPSLRAGYMPLRNTRDFAGFTRDLLEDVMPLIERMYRVSTRADDRAIAGFSMGGNQARLIGLDRLDVFHWIASFSGTFSIGATVTDDALEETFANLFDDTSAASQSLRLLWFACGKDETRLVAENQMFADVLARHQIKHTFVTIPGGHTFHVWRRNLRDLLPLLFTK